MCRLGYTGVRCFSHRPPFAMRLVLYSLWISHPYATRRKLPPASVGSQGPPSAHILLEFRQHGIFDWVRGSMLLNRYLRKIQGFSAVLPDFSIRQLPPAPWGSAGYHVLVYCRAFETQYVGAEGARNHSSDIYLNRIPRAVSPILDPSVFTQAPRGSSDFRRPPTTISTYIVGAQTTMYVGGGRKPKFLSQYLPKI